MQIDGNQQKIQTAATVIKGEKPENRAKTAWGNKILQIFYFH